MLRQEGSENPITIWKEMGAWMTEHVTVMRYNKNLERTDAKLRELLERYRKINLIAIGLALWMLSLIIP